MEITDLIKIGNSGYRGSLQSYKLEFLSLCRVESAMSSICRARSSYVLPTARVLVLENGAPAGSFNTSRGLRHAVTTSPHFRYGDPEGNYF